VKFKLKHYQNPLDMLTNELYNSSHALYTFLH